MFLMLYLKPLRVLLQLVQLLFIVLIRYQTHLYCGVALCTGLRGMGIIVLILSFLKNLGADAAHFFNAEASVPKPGVVMPRIQSMATKLWQLYIAFTALLCFLMLWAGGIEPFDALNYAFSIIATGGFAPTSAGAFIYEQSNYICFVFIFFMFLAGGNFSVYYNALQKEFTF